MTIQLANGNKVRWVGVDSKKAATWQSMKLAADLDYLAFISLWDLGLITNSTYAWIAAHCIEKYTKSLILKNNPDVDPMEIGHNIKNAWNACRQYSTFHQLEEFGVFIDELNSLKTSVRYAQHSIAVSSGLPAILILLGGVLRKEVVGADEYADNYGLAPSLFMPRPGTNEIAQKDKIFKILHLFFEHNITFSGLSIPDTFDFAGMNINTENLKNNKAINACPWCLGYNQHGQAATFALRKFLETK